MRRLVSQLSLLALTGLGSCQLKSEQPVLAPAATGTVDVTISSGADDVQELAFGKLIFADPTLELSQTGELVALRFNNLTVPQGAGITKAYLTMTAARLSEEAGTFAIRAANEDTAAPFSPDDGSVRGLTSGYATASWETEAWTQGERLETVDLSYVVAEVVAREGWASGNSMTLSIVGLGGAMKTAAAYELSGTQPVALHIEYDTSVPNNGYGGYLPLGPIELPEESCLKTGRGKLTTITGFHQRRISARRLTDARIDGHGMRILDDFHPFVAENNIGSFCLSGGILTTKWPKTTDWDTTHGSNAMYFYGTPNLTVEYIAGGVDDQIVGDGITIKQDNPNWIFRDSYIQRAGDDGIENDRYNDGLADNIMIDSAFQGMSCRHEPNGFSAAKPYHWTVQNSLIALDEVRSHNLFKTTIIGQNYCHISLRNNVFLLPKEAGLVNPNDGPNLKEPLLIESNCVGAKNTIVYTGKSQKYLEYLKRASPVCFDVTTDRGVWEAARADWFNRHTMFKAWQ